MDDNRVLAALERLEAGQHELAQRFEQMDRRFEQIDSRFERVDERFSRMDAAMLQLREEVLDFRVVVMTRFERMEDRQTATATDITVNMAAAAQAMRRQENDREELRLLNDLIMKMQMQVRRLQTDVGDLQKKAS